MIRQRFADREEIYKDAADGSITTKRRTMRERNEKGYITVFLSLMTAVILLLVTAAIEIAVRKEMETKAVIASNKAGSHMKGYFHSYVFEEYHILLLDKGLFGGTIAGLEAEMESNLTNNLGDGYQVHSAEITKCAYLVDEDLAAFREQIVENSIYLAGEAGVEKMLYGAKAEEEPIDEEMLDRIDDEINGHSEAEIEEAKREKEKKDGHTEEEGSSSDGQKEKVKERKDPRKEVEKFMEQGVAGMIRPKEITFSDNSLSGEKLPSEMKYGFSHYDSKADEDAFHDYEKLKENVTSTSGWGRKAADNASALLYINSLFNSALKHKKDGTVLKLEKEYLIAGKRTDSENYEAVVNRIILLRLGPNFAYLLTDIPKMEIVTEIAAALTSAFLPAEPVVKYLLAGCWAYIESVADTYRLLRGHKVPIIKRRENWLTDFDSLGHLDELTGTDSESGLDYDAYLLLLIGLGMEKAYYRMLDLIQENANFNQPMNSPKLYIENAITAFEANVEIMCKGSSYWCTVSQKY